MNVEWIKVSDRLPETKGFYLVVYANDSNPAESTEYYWSGIHWHCDDMDIDDDFLDEFERIHNDSVTHWMPLPEPPKEI